MISKDLKTRRSKDQSWRVKESTFEDQTIFEASMFQLLRLWPFWRFFKIEEFLKDLQKAFPSRTRASSARPFSRVDWRGRNRRKWRFQNRPKNSMSAIFQSRARSLALKFDTHRVFPESSSEIPRKTRWVPIFKSGRVGRLWNLTLIELFQSRACSSTLKIDEIRRFQKSRIFAIFDKFQNWVDGDHFFKIGEI